MVASGVSTMADLEMPTFHYDEFGNLVDVEPNCGDVHQPRGLGDTIASITHTTGIAQAVEYVADKLGVDCGCKKRQEALNKLVSYKDNGKDSK